MHMIDTLQDIYDIDIFYKGSRVYTEFLSIKKKKDRDFPGDPVVKTLGFHCRGLGFSSWSGS